jgi:hypothetical protein
MRFLGSSPRAAAGEPTDSVLVFAGARGCPKHADASLVVEPALAAGP